MRRTFLLCLLCFTVESLAFTDHTSVSPASSLETWGFEVGALASDLPHILGRMTFPFSLTAEVAGSVDQLGGALQWTFTDKVWMIHFADIAIKAKYADRKTSDLFESSYGFNILISRTFGIVEPYASLGYLKSKDDRSTAQGILGMNLFPTPFLALGGEYSRAFGRDTFAGKLSFQFD